MKTRQELNKLVTIPCLREYHFSVRDAASIGWRHALLTTNMISSPRSPTGPTSLGLLIVHEIPAMNTTLADNVSFGL